MTTNYTPKLHAGSIFPTIDVTTLDGDTVTLGKPQGSATWQLVVIYRGQHCPLCSKYLNELKQYREQLESIGVDIVAVSADSKEQLHAHTTRTDKHHFEALNFPVGYGLTLDDMQALGLYISEPRNAEETDHDFAELGLFVINEHGTVQVADISNNPFVRPELSTLINGLVWIRNPDNNYPIRGRRGFD